MTYRKVRTWSICFYQNEAVHLKQCKKYRMHVPLQRHLPRIIWMQHEDQVSTKVWQNDLDIANNCRAVINSSSMDRFPHPFPYRQQNSKLNSSANDICRVEFWIYRSIMWPAVKSTRCRNELILINSPLLYHSESGQEIRRILSGPRATELYIYAFRKRFGNCTKSIKPLLVIARSAFAQHGGSSTVCLFPKKEMDPQYH